MGAATHLSYSQQPVGYTSEGVLVTQPVVQALDAGNAVDTSYVGVVTLTPSVATSQFYTTTEKFKTTHTVQAGSTTTALTLSPALTFDPSLPANYSGINAGIIFTSGLLSGVSRYIASTTGTTVANVSPALGSTPAGGETVVVRSGVMFDSQAVACVAGVATFANLSLSGHQPTALVASSPGLTSATSATLTATGTFAVCRGVTLPVELPRVVVDTSEPTYEATVYTINPSNNDVSPNFKTHTSALTWFAANDSATARQVLTQGVSYNEFVTLPNRAPGKGLIHFKWNANPLASNQRATPANMGGCPQITTKDNTSGVMGPQTYTGSNTVYNYRFTGYDFQVQTPTNPTSTAIFQVIAIWDGVGNTAAGMPQYIGFNQCLVRGTSQTELQRAVFLGCKDFFFINGSTADVHMSGNGDTQAFIMGGSCQGPLLIKNDKLEAAGEISMTGGADTPITGMVCSDVQILNNTWSRQVAWKRSAVGIYVSGSTWQCKNHLEFKSGRRWQVEGNTFENEWYDAQDVSLVIGSASQSGTSPWQGNRDLLVRYNAWRNVCQAWILSGENSGGSGGRGSQVIGRRVAVHDNLVAVNNLNGTTFSEEPGSAPKNIAIGAQIRSLKVLHNTIVGDPTISSSTSGIEYDDAPNADNAFNYNILAFPYFGITGGSGGFYGAQFTTGFPAGALKNVLLDLDNVHGAPFSSYDPTWGNSTFTTAGFADATINARIPTSTFDQIAAALTLTTGAGGSLYNTAHSFTGDGTDAGADMTALRAAIATPGTSTAWLVQRHDRESVF